MNKLQVIWSVTKSYVKIVIKILKEKKQIMGFTLTHTMYNPADDDFWNEIDKLFEGETNANRNNRKKFSHRTRRN